MNKPDEIAKHAYCINDCVCKESINYVIADGGGSVQMKTLLHRDGPAYDSIVP